jgi:glutathione peroxidase
MKNLTLKVVGLTALSISLLFALMAFQTKPQASTNTTKKKSMTIYDFSLKTIDGKLISLAQFKGKKLLLVNVASKCGYTPQYMSLENLSDMYKGKVVVIGFPANNFGGQEPGTNKEIKEFCKINYEVSFLLMEKISVQGEDMHPLYKWLSNIKENGICGEAPDWNFCKYLISEKGIVLGFYKSNIDPLSNDIVGQL